MGVEPFRGVGDKIEEGLDALWVALVYQRRDVGLARQDLVDAKPSQVVLVLGQGGGEDPRAPSAASWTAKLPTPPLAPTTRMVSPSETAQRPRRSWR